LLTILVLVCIAALLPPHTSVSAQSGSDFFWTGTAAPTSAIVSATTQTFVIVTGLKLSNKATGTSTDTFDISVVLPSSNWDVEISPSDVVAIKRGSQDVAFTFKLTIPAGWPPGTQVFTVIAKRQPDNAEASAFFTLNLTAATATAPAPAPGTVCPEHPDPGNDIDHASLILVDRAEKHGICTAADEDWFKFGGLANKVYSLAITQMDDGLDLSLELYDDQGVLLDNNDDNTSTLPVTDTKPLIKSFRAPRNGLYYVRVRDTLSIGGKNLSYTFIVIGESYGTNPNTVPPVASVCNDKYEQDGLPELANLITTNETQKEHLLCPTGDSDWIKFYALAEPDYTYVISTNTKSYGIPEGSPEPGADTILYLFGRDGVSLIGSNNNFSGTLDSLIAFVPTVSGFYYAQVKNVSDIGTQFIKYDLTLSVCLPGTCPIASASGQAAQPPIQASNPPPPPPSNPPINDPQFLPLSTPNNAVPPGFADLSFARVWQRTDQPIAQQRTTRSWMWGPSGWLARTESYVQADGGLRQVQYFDKGRMEINNPQGDRDSQWFVSSGLLVNELISGKLQIGNTEFTLRSPANIVIAGDNDDPNAPTYASFAGVTDRYPGDRTGQIPADFINRAGAVSSYTGPQRAETRLAHFVPQTKHNIPQVFWNFVNASGPVYEQGQYRTQTLMNWVFVLGYPISDAYWVRVQVGGVEQDVLVQAFERRVLTYMPDAPSGWQVQMGNVGRHYYEWRYSEAPPS
jgi:hypothetical protein